MLDMNILTLRSESLSIDSQAMVHVPQAKAPLLAHATAARPGSTARTAGSSPRHPATAAGPSSSVKCPLRHGTPNSALEIRWLKKGGHGVQS